jgi:hypothetical protein
MNEPTRTGITATLVGVVRQFVEAVMRFVEWLVSVVLNRPPGGCADIPNVPPGCQSNPKQCGYNRVIVFDAGGQLMTYPGCPNPATNVVQRAGIKGFDAGSRLESSFPPASKTLVRAAHFSQPARVEAFNAAGSVVDVQVMAPTPGVEQGLTLSGSSISRIVVTPSGDTIVIEICQ